VRRQAGRAFVERTWLISGKDCASMEGQTSEELRNNLEEYRAQKEQVRAA